MQTLSAAFRTIRQTNSTDANYPSRVPRLAYTAGADNQPSGVGNSAAQATASAVFDLASTRVQPNTDGVIDSTDKAIQNLILMTFFGTGVATNTFKARVIGWRYAVGRDTDKVKETAMWIPVTLFDMTITLGTAPGLTNGLLDANQLLATNIVIIGTSGNANVSADIVAPNDNTIAHIVLDMKGFQKLEVIFDRNSSATSCNGLIAMY
jgi:hypothetical protein